ncbi:MAG: hypothetical protein U0575_09310 [Phycisphaerales bacterium]
MSMESPSDPRSLLRRWRRPFGLVCMLVLLGARSAPAGAMPADCCVPHGGTGCDSRICESLVCAIDSFCCAVAWDSICADEAAGFVECGCGAGPVGCGETRHSCFTSGPPGCENAACCTGVCAVDPSCCDTTWDVGCIDLALDFCHALMQPNLGISDLQACVLPDGSLQVAWNNQFLPEWTYPKQLGTVSVVVTIESAATTISREFFIHYFPAEGFNAECQRRRPDGCDAGQCAPWLATVVSDTPLELISLSASCLQSPGGCICGITHFPMVMKVAIPLGERGAAVSVVVDPGNFVDELDESDNAMLALVTSADACPTGACCLPDGTCVDGLAQHDCAVVRHGQFQGNGSTCAEAIGPCPIEGTCVLDHDILAGCIETDEATCVALGGVYLGDATMCMSNCCIEHGSLDCDDSACMDLVCVVDRFCCSVVWDRICADEAIEKCAVCTPNPVGAPANNDCAGAVEVTDGQTVFSTLNANSAGPSHPGACIIGADVWFTYHATTPGAVRVSLCGSDFDTMLAVYDNDWCDLSDDTLVACNDNACGTASQLTFVAGACGEGFLIRVGGWNSDSGAGGVLLVATARDCPLRPNCPADLDGDRSVDGSDLGLLLGNWGGAGLGDLDGDGSVGGADLGLMLGAWGGCL